MTRKLKLIAKIRNKAMLFPLMAPFQYVLNVLAYVLRKGGKYI